MRKRPSRTMPRPASTHPAPIEADLPRATLETLLPMATMFLPPEAPEARAKLEELFGRLLVSRELRVSADGRPIAVLRLK